MPYLIHYIKIQVFIDNNAIFHQLFTVNFTIKLKLINSYVAINFNLATKAVFNLSDLLENFRIVRDLHPL